MHNPATADEARQKWDRMYSDCPLAAGPADVLAENIHLLPPAGHALDLACGPGGNALFLARLGFRVSAWDISKVAIERLASLAQNANLTVEANVRDVETMPFPVETFDVVVVSRFLSRKLAGSILGSLKPGGVLFYQTYVQDKPGAHGPRNPDYLLGENELLAMFRDMRVLFYREEARVGDVSAGTREEAYFVGQKR